jgi:hypothetical protein
MYGYIPLEKASRLKEAYTIATPQTWTFERNGQMFGGVEESEFSEVQKAELEALGGGWFEYADDFSDWLYAL